MTPLRLFLAILAAALYAGAPAACEVPDSVAARYAGRETSPVEGVWAWSDGGVVAIDTDADGSIVFTLLDSPDPVVVTPQRMGHGTFTGSGCTYNATLATRTDPVSGVFDGSTGQCVVSIDGDGMLNIRPYKTGFRLNLWRFVPYLFRHSVVKDKAPAGLSGAVRIFPLTANKILPPVL